MVVAQKIELLLLVVVKQFRAQALRRLARASWNGLLRRPMDQIAELAYPITRSPQPVVQTMWKMPSGPQNQARVHQLAADLRGSRTNGRGSGPSSDSRRGWTPNAVRPLHCRESGKKTRDERHGQLISRDRRGLNQT